MHYYLKISYAIDNWFPIEKMFLKYFFEAFMKSFQIYLYTPKFLTVLTGFF